MVASRTRRRPVLRCTALAAALLAPAACLNTQDQIQTLQQYNAISASPSSTPDYDYSVVMKNLRPLGVDLDLKVDRERLAVAYLGDRCPNGRIVSETVLASTLPGLNSRLNDYAVRLKC